MGGAGFWPSTVVCLDRDSKMRTTQIPISCAEIPITDPDAKAVGILGYPVAPE